MSGPGNNDSSMSNTESGPACLDLENAQFHVENELRTSDCIPIGLADDSAANISLVDKVTKRIPHEAGTECLQESMSESSVADSTLNGCTEVKERDVKIIETNKNHHERNQNDIAIKESSYKSNISDEAISPISTELSINRKPFIQNETDFFDTKTNNMPVTEEESFKDHSSSITDSLIEERAKNTPGNMGSTKDIKESVSSSAYEFIENEEYIPCIWNESPKDITFDVKQDQDSPTKIVNPETVFNPSTGNTKDINVSEGSSEMFTELPGNHKMVFKSGELPQDQDSPENIVNPVSTYSQNMENTKKNNESVSNSESLNELTENKMVLESGELSHDQGSPAKTKNPETIYNQDMGNIKDIKESVNELLQNKQCMELVSGELSGDTTIDVKQDSPVNIFHPETIYYPNIGNNQDINASIGISESVNKIIESEEVILESGELSEDTTVDVQQDAVKDSEESEVLEDGEVSDNDDSVPIKVPVCRFFIRNGCSWGNNCRFRHPGTNKKGNYVMFENKVLPVVSTPLHPVWTPSVPPAYPFNLNSVNVDRHYSQDAPEGPKRAPLLPTPSFNDILLAQKNYTKLDDLKRPVRNLPQPVVWSSRLSTSSPCTTAFQPSPGRNRSPSVSPPRRAHHVPLEVKPADTATLASKPSIKRYRLPSPLPSSATRTRGPRTPPCSPPTRPSATVQTAPKRQRLYTYLSSSTDSSDSSSYTSTTDSSEESSSSSSSDSDSDSDSDEEYRSLSSRHRIRKQPSKRHAKSPPRASTKCSSRQLHSARRLETSVKNQTSRHTSKSKSRKHSKTKKNSSKRTPEKDLPRRLLGDGNSSYSGRREYLLMKLFQVEKLIAKKKKKMNMK